MKIAFNLGDHTIHAVVHQQKTAFPTMLNVHHDEPTSVAAGLAHIAQSGGRIIELVHPGQRLITFSLEGWNYSFDPNRIFSDEGIVATLRKHSVYSEPAHRAIKSFAGEYLRQFALDQEPVIIALHNTLDGIFSVESFSERGELSRDAVAAHITPRRSSFDFFYVTEKNFYDYLKDCDYNVVLQDNEQVTEDGSLSVHFAHLGIPYVNVEAEMSRQTEQEEMLAAVREMLRELGVENKGGQNHFAT